MFCMNCGKQLPDGARFCPDCGAKQAQPPVQQAEKNRKTWWLVLIAVLAVAVVAAAVFGIVKLIDSSSPSRGVSVSDEDEEEEEDSATLEQVLLAQSVRVAQLAGQTAGADDYLTATNTPENIFNYARSFALLAEQPKRVLWCSASEFLATYPEAVGDMSAQLVISSLSAVLNGRFAGNEMLAAASVVSSAEMAKLPEALDEAILFVLEYDVEEGTGPKALVVAEPSVGKLTAFSCTPLGYDVFEYAGLHELDCWQTADRDEVEEAVKAAEDVSLRAKAAPNVTVDAAWYEQQATAVLDRFAAVPSETVQSTVSLFTSEAEVVEMATVLMRAAAAGPIACAVYPIDMEKLLDSMEISEEAAAALAQSELTGLFERRMAMAIPASYGNRYGVSAMAASSIAVKVTSMADAPSTAAPLPEDFVPQIVVFELQGGRYAMVALFDAGNNILGTAVSFVLSGEVINELEETLG